MQGTVAKETASKSLERHHGVEDETKGHVSAGERRARSIKVNIKSCFTTLDELFQFANKHKHHFVSLVEPVAKETGAAFFDPDLKGQVRCQSKTKFESMYLNLALDSQRAWTDIVRDTLSYANLTDMYKRTPAHRKGRKRFTPGVQRPVSTLVPVVEFQD